MEPTEKGDWFKEKTLGTGGFGLVVLWRNKETKEALALKHCRCGHELSEKQSKRWQLEVDIMRRLDHTNVVKALAVPAELDVPPTETPVLAMEYCTQGDLRRMLNRPESCCGLPEITVRNLLHDVSSAVNYLHSMRIVHRDLKPENIVLQQDVDLKTVYKLIDLGYAKELDDSSLCQSFVGTLQYLAPELFLSHEYSRSVDFWSLGLVAHECMVGFRPFLPTMTPAQWMQVVLKKKSSNICVYTDLKGQICYSDNLFSENHLTRPFIDSMEKWLRFMVEWDPKKRGVKCDDNGQEEVIAFSLLESILAEKIVTLFSVANGKTYSYKVNEETSMDTLLQWFAADSNTTVEETEFILPRGLSPDTSKSAVQCWSPQEEEVDWLLYAFPKAELTSTLVQNQDISLVAEMLRNKKVPTPYMHQRHLWAKAVHFVHQVRQMHLRRLQALKKLMMNLLMRCIPLLNKTSVRLVKNLDKLQAKLEFCQESMKNDKKNYDEQVAQGGLKHTALENSFQCDAFVRKLRDLRNRVTNEEQTVSRVNAKMVELQRSPYAHPKQKHDEFDAFYKNAADIFQKLKEKPKELRSISSDNTEMVIIVNECMKARDTLLRPFFLHLEKVRSCKQEVSDAMTPLQKCEDSIAQLEAELSSLQLKRQELIWKAVRCLTNKLKGSPQSGEVSSSTNGPYSTSIGHASNPFQSFMSPASFTSSDGNPLSLSNILCQTSKASKNIVKENQECLSLLQDQMSSLNSPGNDVDWGYLDKIKRPPNNEA